MESDLWRQTKAVDRSPDGLVACLGKANAVEWVGWRGQDARFSVVRGERIASLLPVCVYVCTCTWMCMIVWEGW